MSRRTRTSALALVMLASCTRAASPPASSTEAVVPAVRPQVGAVTSTDPGARRDAAFARRGSRVLSVGSAGHPSLLAALDGEGAAATNTASPAPAALSHEAAARAHLEAHREAFGVDGSVLDGAEVVYAAALPAGMDGSVVRFRQRSDGALVEGGDVRVLMGKGHRLVAIAGAFQSLPAPRAAAFRLSSLEAVAAALTARYRVPVLPGALVEETAPSGRRRARYATPVAAQAVRLASPVAVERVLVPLPAAAPDHLRAAWSVEGYFGPKDRTDSEALRILVDAADGTTLATRDLTAADNFTYRVWAWNAGDNRPTDGPFADFSPHPVGKPDGSYPAALAPILVTLSGKNDNHLGGSDPWLDMGATESRGNNADAYVDRTPPDGYSNGDFRATATAASTFDRTYDLTQSPASNDQAMAGIIQMFYDANWLHDWHYNSGFDEAAGNGQLDNLGRGGVGGDPLLLEAQDYSGRNNANMATPSDGLSPRMQMYLWNGPSSLSLTLAPGGSPAAGTADFGPQSFDTTGAVVLANDGSMSPTLACQPLGNAALGKVVLVDRGGCQFNAKTANAQAGGAIGVLLADNVVAGTPPGMSNGNPPIAVNIPTLSITNAAGQALKASLLAGAVSAHLVRVTSVDRDSTIDNTVVAHEWGHYLHHRLADCSLQQCSAMSEGWADYNALQMILRDGDNLTGTYAVGIYDAKEYGDSGYFGIRREPYTSDMTKNGLTFKHITDGVALPVEPTNGNGGPNSEVHNAGEVWATMMFDGYLALQTAAGKHMPPIAFDTVRRTMSNYVVAGLKITPTEATYTEQRDAVLAAASVGSMDDLATLAAAFARRGAGSCAASPPRDSTNFKGVVESFEVKPRLHLGAVTLDDSVHPCTADGVLDAGETGLVTLALGNAGAAAMANSKVTFASATPGVSFPSGASVMVANVAPFAAVSASVPMALDASVKGMQRIDVTVTVDNAATCEGTATSSVAFRANYDESPMSAARDDVESEHPLWTPGGAPGGVPARVWSRLERAPLSHVWMGVDWGAVSDTYLVSPPLVLDGMNEFVIDADSRYSFETSPDQNNVTAYWDGGLIEVSTDGGNSWTDVSKWADPGYSGNIYMGANNPLSGRRAFVGQNAAYPMQDHIKVSLGKALGMATVRVRFRIGTDEAGSDFGWELDNLAFAGLANKPFATLVDHAAVCLPDIAADAGADQSVAAGQLVAIDASASRSNKGRPLTFSWAQASGPAVALVHAQGATAAFVAPSLPAPSALAFTVTVSDGMGSATATTHVSVAAAPGDMTVPVDLAQPDLATAPAPDLALAAAVDAAEPKDAATASPSSGCGCRVGARRDEGRGAQALALASVLLGATLSRRRRQRR